MNLLVDRNRTSQMDSHLGAYKNRADVINSIRVSLSKGLNSRRISSSSSSSSCAYQHPAASPSIVTAAAPPGPAGDYLRSQPRQGGSSGGVGGGLSRCVDNTTAATTYTSGDIPVLRRSESEKEKLILRGLKRALKPVCRNGVVKCDNVPPYTRRPPSVRGKISPSFSAQNRLDNLTKNLQEKRASVAQEASNFGEASSSVFGGSKQRTVSPPQQQQQIGKTTPGGGCERTPYYNRGGGGEVLNTIPEERSYRFSLDGIIGCGNSPLRRPRSPGNYREANPPRSSSSAASSSRHHQQQQRGNFRDEYGLSSSLSPEDVAWASCSGYVPATPMRRGISPLASPPGDKKQLPAAVPQVEVEGEEECHNTTTDEDIEEPMDWQNIPQEVLLKTLRLVRMTPMPNAEVPPEISRNNRAGEMAGGAAAMATTKPPDERDLHIVVDTNILVSSLKLIRNIVKSSIRGFRAIVVIPWQVIKELDYLKERRNKSPSISSPCGVRGEDFSLIALQARKAMAMLIEYMEQKDCRVVLQSMSDASRQLEGVMVESPDDEILKACLQLHHNGHYVVLCTNDRNLILKGKSYTLICVNNDVLERFLENPGLRQLQSGQSCLEIPPPADTEPCNVQVFQIAHHLATITLAFLSSVIEEGLRREYKGMWEFHASVSRPWSILDVVQCLQMQWETITKQQKTTKEAFATLVKIHDFFRSSAYDDNLTETSLQSVVFILNKLSRSLPAVFKTLAETYLCGLGEIANGLDKIVNGEAGDGAFKTIVYMQKLDKDVRLICLSLMNGLGRTCVLGDMSDLENEILPEFSVVANRIDDIISILQSTIAALFSLEVTKLGDVSTSSSGVQELYKVLVTFAGCLSEVGKLRPQDVAYFANNRDVRMRWGQARESLQQTQKYFLEGKRIMELSTRKDPGIVRYGDYRQR